MLWLLLCLVFSLFYFLFTLSSVGKWKNCAEAAERKYYYTRTTTFLCLFRYCIRKERVGGLVEVCLVMYAYLIYFHWIFSLHVCETPTNDKKNYYDYCSSWLCHSSHFMLLVCICVRVQHCSVLYNLFFPQLSFGDFCCSPVPSWCFYYY